MSEIKVNSIKGVGASTAAITVNNTDGTCTANITNNLSNRNIVINGAAQVNQRGSQTGKTSSTYFVDRFRCAMGNAGTWNLTRSSESPNGFARSMKLDCTTAKSSLDADSYMIFQQKIEGYNVQAFAKGTSAAKQFAVSFYLKSNVSGTYTAEVQDNDNNRIISKTFTVSDGNWNRYSLIFPADTTGAFGDDNGHSMSLNIWLMGGSNYTSGTLNTSSWATKANANRVSSSNVNVASSTSNELYFTGVQIEVGDTVTDFEHRSFAQELALCQRYYETSHSYGTAFGTNTSEGKFLQNGSTNGAGNQQSTIYFRTTKRANPTVTGHYDGTTGSWYGARSGASGTTSVSFDLIGMNSFRAYNSIGANYVASEHIGHWQAVSEL